MCFTDINTMLNKIHNWHHSVSTMHKCIFGISDQVLRNHIVCLAIELCVHESEYPKLSTDVLMNRVIITAQSKHYFKPYRNQSTQYLSWPPACSVHVHSNNRMINLFITFHQTYHHIPASKPVSIVAPGATSVASSLVYYSAHVHVFVI